MRTGRYAGGTGKRAITRRIAKITIRCFELGDAAIGPDADGIGDLNVAALVRQHKYAAIGTVLSAQAAADAVVLNHNLKVFSAMNRIHRASDHAMWICAGAA